VRRSGKQNSSSNRAAHFPQGGAGPAKAFHFPQQEFQVSSAEKWKARLTLDRDPRYLVMESKLDMPQIVNRVKELRIALGLTQEQLAQAAGVSRQSINSIERNRYVPSLELALTFARIFTCSTDQIFRLENQP
jgi:putative transcriptional regulator